MGRDEVMGVAETCQLVGAGKSTLARWRMRGEGPPFVVVGPRFIRYRRSAVDAWMASRERTMTSAGAGVGQ